jgi:hypothetical protein
VGEWFEERKLYWTTLREIYEEVFGGSDAERSKWEDKPDWYCEKRRGVESIRAREFGAETSVTGFGIDAKQRYYPVSALVCVPDPGYWDRFYGTMKTMWEHENKHFLELSSRNSTYLKELIVGRTWSGDALFALLEAITVLRARYPNLVDLPTLQHEI